MSSSCPTRAGSAGAPAPPSTPRCPAIDRSSGSSRQASRTSPGTARTTAAPSCRHRGRGMAGRVTASVPPCARASSTFPCSMPRTACSVGRPSPCSTHPAAPARLRPVARRSSTIGATRRRAARLSAPSARSWPATVHPRRPISATPASTPRRRPSGPTVTTPPADSATRRAWISGRISRARTSSGSFTSFPRLRRTFRSPRRTWATSRSGSTASTRCTSRASAPGRWRA